LSLAKGHDANTVARKPATDRAGVSRSHVLRGNAVDRSGASLPISLLQSQLMAAGLITSVPNPVLDIDDDPDDQPVAIKGEPLSATVIRERH
jgi:hypothetical protein